MTPTQRDDDSPTDEPGATLAQNAADADNAVTRLAHQLTSNPAATPADVDVILGHLANTVATLPQVAQRLTLVLDRSQSTWELSMDGMTSTTDPDVAIATARAHLDALDQPLRQTYRHLHSARNEAAHIRANPPEDYDKPTTRSRPRPRPEERGTLTRRRRGLVARTADPSEPPHPPRKPTMNPIHIPDDWHENALLTFEEFCDLIHTPQRTVRDWRQRGIGPRWARFNGCGRLYVTVAEARRFLRAAIADTSPYGVGRNDRP